MLTLLLLCGCGYLGYRWYRNKQEEDRMYRAEQEAAESQNEEARWSEPTYYEPPYQQKPEPYREKYEGVPRREDYRYRPYNRPEEDYYRERRCNDSGNDFMSTLAASAVGSLAGNAIANALMNDDDNHQESGSYDSYSYENSNDGYFDGGGADSSWGSDDSSSWGSDDSSSSWDSGSSDW